MLASQRTTCSSGDLSTARWRETTSKQSDIFPMRLAPFGQYLMPVPRSFSQLDANYGTDWKEICGGWLKNNSGSRMLRVPCATLHGRHAFTFSNEKHEVLKLGDTLMQTFDIASQQVVVAKMIRHNGIGKCTCPGHALTQAPGFYLARGLAKGPSVHPPLSPAGSNGAAVCIISLAVLTTIGASIYFWPRSGGLVSCPMSPKMQMIPMQQVLAATALTTLATMQSILVEEAKVNGRVHFHMPSAVFYTEVIKLAIAFALWQYQRCRGEGGAQWQMSWRVLSYVIPAAIFVVQNNLTYMAMQLLDPPTFQLWVCFRLLPAGIFARVILKQHQMPTQWIALCLLVFGMMTTRLSCSTARTNVSDTDQQRGILILIVNGFLGSFNGVLNEWLIKFQDPAHHLMLKNMQMYGFGVLVALPACKPRGFVNFTPLAWSIVVCNAFLGLSTSVVLKYTDSLVKNYVSSLAVLLSTALSVYFSGFVITSPFVIGTCVVFSSSLLYFRFDVPPAVTRDKQTTIITFGTFGVLHYGHIRILKRARQMGDRMVVGLSTDELNMQKKNRVPVYPFAQRKAILDALECVDEVFAEASLEEKADYIHQYGATVLVMGDDWKGKFDGLASAGVEVRYLERTPAISTTHIIETIQRTI